MFGPGMRWWGLDPCFKCDTADPDPVMTQVKALDVSAGPNDDGCGPRLGQLVLPGDQSLLGTSPQRPHHPVRILVFIQ